MEINPTKQLLLATKFTLPHSYVPLVIPRVRLYSKLERGTGYPLTLLAAPAGFGKTILLSSWLRQRGTNKVAWLSLDKNDNDLQRFWHYCLAACASVDKELVASAQACLDAYPAVSIEQMLTVFINALMAYPEPLIWVLDDYQCLHLPAIHQTLTFLLEHLPPHIHLFISTRVDPPLPLARLRVRGQLLEIRSNDLRFNVEESVQLLSYDMQLQLEPEQIVNLFRATEGWIAGLQLAVISLQGRPEHEEKMAWISSFTGTNRHIAHYLREEILMTLPEDVQDFLFSTSILTRMRADLCDAVTGQENAELMFEWLERANLFIASSEEEGTWKRYHQLFAELLRQHLAQKYPERINELHLRASCWYEHENMLHEAVEHALAASSYERAADLLEAHAWPLWVRGQLPYIFDWLLLLQGRIELQTHPIISYLYAFIYLYTAQWKMYEQALASAQTSWQCGHNHEMLSSIYDLKAYHALCTGNGEQALMYTQQALEANQNKPLLASFSHILRGAGHLCCGDIQQAQIELTLGQRCGSQMNCAIAISSAQLYQGRLYVMQGQLHEALRLYQQCSNNSGGCVALFARQAHLQAGLLYLEWNELERAQEQLRKAHESRNQLEGSSAVIDSIMLATRLAWASGKPEQALVLLDQAESSLTSRGNQSEQLARISLLRTKYWLAQGKNAAVQELLQSSYPVNLQDLPLLEQECWQQAYARWLLARKRPTEVTRLLLGLLLTIKAQGRIADELQIQLLLVQAYFMLGDARRTRQTLEHMLVIAEPGGYHRLFLEEGQILMSLLSDLYHRQQKRYTGELQSQVLGYVHTLLLEFGCDVEPRDWCSWQKRAQRAQSSLEQLSDRELEVLKLIAEGNSNQQIACALVVAESTIKTHLNNIYSKLNVNSRLQALTKAHTVGLLEI
ncbi:LuxR C-terminal-related transcriptional regulator [Dictyobacter kobayashii]|uniref:Helix-turn-helix transcriptional regulator n=1 Tax=Dictyobacter kobayashii TaxID=2014872 RepID=A0A402AJA1_9CHLR|nr:LuxR C-terminal-related transcriptional regulator [Dictyobacter kobayashii]GCE19176.1 helix-turn-helix transcriptional regulator [Dictyobacter kobayashii]